MVAVRRTKNGSIKLPLFIVIFLLVAAFLRIATLPIQSHLPRLSQQQHGHYDYEGVIHWHTRYSADAIGTYETAAELGNQYHIDFLITTEHNNLEALKDHKEGWHGQMLTLVGIESTRHEGYLLGLNLEKYTTRDAPTDAFLSEMEQQGGFTIIAHPQSPRWHWRGKIDPRFVGEEIIDLTDQFTTASPASILTALLFYRINTAAAYLQIYQRPIEALRMWDEISSERNFIGIYAPDVHQSIRMFGRHIIRFPKANDVFPIAHDHVIMARPFTGDLSQDKPMLYDSIRKGHIYIAIDSLQDATGFFFSAHQGNKIAWMGDQLPAGENTSFLVRLPKPLGLENCVINVYHNGQKMASSTASAYVFQSSLPGSYRVEVEVDLPTFWGFKKKIVWVYSNPIYLR